MCSFVTKGNMKSCHFRLIFRIGVAISKWVWLITINLECESEKASQLCCGSNRRETVKSEREPLYIIY